MKVKMLNTYVHSLPDGSEKGRFLALDLGGSNFRVLLIGKPTPLPTITVELVIIGRYLLYYYLFIPCNFVIGEPSCFIILIGLFSLLAVEIKDREISQLDKKLQIDDRTKQSTQEELFDFVAGALCQFEKEHTITEKLPIGFTFSFPVHQTSLISGTLIRWTKDFTATGAEGQDVTKMLQDALRRKGVST